MELEGYQLQSIKSKRKQTQLILSGPGNDPARTIECNDIWGFRLDGALFRIEPEFGQPALVVLESSPCYYENGAAHLKMYLNGTTEATVVHGVRRVPVARPERCDDRCFPDQGEAHLQGPTEIPGGAAGIRPHPTAAPTASSTPTCYGPVSRPSPKDNWNEPLPGPPLRPPLKTLRGGRPDVTASAWSGIFH